MFDDRPFGTAHDLAVIGGLCAACDQGLDSLCRRAERRSSIGSFSWNTTTGELLWSAEVFPKCMRSRVASSPGMRNARGPARGTPGHSWSEVSC